MFAVFAPTLEQNFTQLTYGTLNFMQYSSKETNASAPSIPSGGSLLKLQRFQVNVTQCMIRVLSPDLTLESPDGQGIDFAAHLVYPPHLACDFTQIKPLMGRVLNSSRDMAAATQRIPLDKAYDDALSALSNHQWIYCNWLTESLTAFKEEERIIPNTMDCWEKPGSAAWAQDPCCNVTCVWK